MTGIGWGIVRSLVGDLAAIVGHPKAIVVARTAPLDVIPAIVEGEVIINSHSAAKGMIREVDVPIRLLEPICLAIETPKGLFAEPLLMLGTCLVSSSSFFGGRRILVILWVPEVLIEIANFVAGHFIPSVPIVAADAIIFSSWKFKEAYNKETVSGVSGHVLAQKIERQCRAETTI